MSTDGSYNTLMGCLSGRGYYGEFPRNLYYSIPFYETLNIKVLCEAIINYGTIRSIIERISLGNPLTKAEQEMWEKMRVNVERTSETSVPKHISEVERHRRNKEFKFEMIRYYSLLSIVFEEER